MKRIFDSVKSLEYVTHTHRLESYFSWNDFLFVMKRSLWFSFDI